MSEPQESATNPPRPSRPFDEDELENWRWISAERKTRRLEPYAGRFIAVYRKAVVESGSDPQLLRKYVALRDGIDPEQLTIAYMD